jgi:Leucine-rich repeat (LRR) protein
MEEEFVQVGNNKFFLNKYGTLRIHDHNINSIKQIEGIESLSNLIALDLSNTGLKNLDLGLEIYKNLEVLIIKSTPLTKLTGDFKKLKKLSSINLEDTEIKNLPDEIGQLENLLRLNLGSCKLLENLPDSIGDLESLEKLILHNCHNLKELPETIGNLKNLRSINLSLCYSLNSLPDNIGGLESLVLIDLRSCHSLTKIPDSIGNLESLEILDLSHCSSLENLPQNIGNLENLKEIHLDNCNFSEIPPMLYALNLEILQLDDNPLSKGEKGISISPIPVIKEYLKKKAAIRVFLSHSEADFKTINIKEISESLEDTKEIFQAYYSEQYLQGNFDDFMKKNVPKSQILIFFATKNSLNSKPCNLELQLALNNNLQIIPILGNNLNWSDLDSIELYDNSGDKFYLSNMKGLKFSNNISEFTKVLYNHIYNLKRNLDLFDKQEIEYDQFILDFADEINKYIKTEEYHELIKTHFLNIGKIFKSYKSNHFNTLEFLYQIFREII